jgi:hypothetical protein
MAAAPAAVTAPTLAGDRLIPAQASGWVDTKLYFGLARRIIRIRV